MPLARSGVTAGAALADGLSDQASPSQPPVLLWTEADLVAALDDDWGVVAASTTVEDVLGVARGTLVGQTLCNLIAPEDRATVTALASRLRRTGQLRATVRVHTPQGLQWLDVAATEISGHPTAAFYLSARDVTDDHLAMEHLVADEQRWRVAFEHSPIGGCLVAADGSILLSNPALLRMLGFRSDELDRVPLPALDLDDSGVTEASLAALFEGKQRSWSCDRRFRTAAGSPIWCRVTAAPVMGVDGRVAAVIVQLQDVTESREAELQLADQALHDSLTGLPNRFLTRQWLSSALEDQPGRLVGVLFCDLDRFKVVNDSLGHGAGDDLLVQVAERLRRALPDEVLLGRVGGDEFVAVVERVVHERELGELAARMAAALEAPVRLGSHEHAVTLSIGAATGDGAIEGADEVLMRADLALLRAKRSGRARAELFDPNVDRMATAEDLSLEQDLRSSVQAGQLRAHYQPIVSLRDENVAGYETLLRWRHPQQGLLPPERFLQLAETSGLIRPIGWWVLHQACHDAVAHGLAERGAFISVNASPIQLGSPGVLALVERALSESGLRAAALHLEITETTLLNVSPAVLDELRALSALGVKIALDDFGTGYSSLSLLRDLPVDMVKVDKSFIHPMLTDRSALAIVRAVLGMCHDLGIPSVAEGVETVGQARKLLDLGCSHVQGFLYGRPEAGLPDSSTTHQVLGVGLAHGSEDSAVRTSRD
ncbi:MAG: putative bifunctional diguanylate cyclase/phosphodiesterase [Actinomycetales bacterium]